MNTIAHGNACEAAVIYELTRSGFSVLLPFGDGLPFDIAAVGTGGEVIRIQVKSGRVRNGCVEFNACSTDHGHGRRDYRGRADVLAVHVAELGEVFMVTVDDCPRFKGYLRVVAPRNNQSRGIRMADEYRFEAWAAAHGSSSVP